MKYFKDYGKTEMKKFLSGLLLILLTFPLAILPLSCSSQPSAGTIISRSAAALKQVKLYNMEATDDVFYTYAGQVGSVNQWDYDISVDISKKAVKKNSKITETGMTNTEWTSDMYITQGMKYSEANGTGTNIPWTKSALTDEIWTKANKVVYTIPLLENPAGLIVIGDDYVSGTHCYLLQYTPSVGSIIAWIISQQPDYGAIINGIWGTGTYQVSMVKLWVGMDNYLPLRIETNALFSRSSNSSNSMSSSVHSLMSITYNQPFAIQLPLEATNASLQQ